MSLTSFTDADEQFIQTFSVGEGSPYIDALSGCVRATLGDAERYLRGDDPCIPWRAKSPLTAPAMELEKIPNFSFYHLETFALELERKGRRYTEFLGRLRLLLEHPSFEILLLYWEGFSPDEVARVLVNSPDRPRADSGEDAYVQWYKRTIQNALENGEMTDVDRGGHVLVGSGCFGRFESESSACSSGSNEETGWKIFHHSLESPLRAKYETKSIRWSHKTVKAAKLQGELPDYIFTISCLRNANLEHKGISQKPFLSRQTWKDGIVFSQSMSSNASKVLTWVCFVIRIQLQKVGIIAEDLEPHNVFVNRLFEEYFNAFSQIHRLDEMDVEERVSLIQEEFSPPKGACMVINVDTGGWRLDPMRMQEVVSGS